MKKTILLLFVLLILTGCNILNIDETVIRWTKENSPYLLSTYTVEKDEKLIIEAGVTVEFETGGRLIVKGELSARGTETDSILFTTRSDTTILSIYDYWAGITFDSCDSRTCLEYCRFEKYKFPYLDMAIFCNNSSPTFSYCYFPFFMPMAESGAMTFGCFNNSSPRIEYSILHPASWGYCITCASYPDYNNSSSSNPELISNDIYTYTGTYAVVGGGYLNKNYIVNSQGVIDSSLGSSIDQRGDGVFTTTSISCINVDGINNPQTESHYSNK